VTPKVTEASYAEQPALEWLQEVGGILQRDGAGARPRPSERGIARDVMLRATPFYDALIGARAGVALGKGSGAQ
jgi:hypothetical protein